MVLADSPLSCIRIRTPDLLDANESTWAFVVVGGIGCKGNPQFTAATRTLSQWCHN
jgi:hypothetical protein